MTAATSRVQQRPPESITKPLAFIFRAPDKAVMTAGAFVLFPLALLILGLIDRNGELIVSMAIMLAIGFGVLGIVAWNESRFRANGYAPKKPNRYWLRWDR